MAEVKMSLQECLTQYKEFYAHVKRWIEHFGFDRSLLARPEVEQCCARRGCWMWVSGLVSHSVISFHTSFLDGSLPFESLLVPVGRENELIAAARPLRLPEETLSAYIATGEPKSLHERIRWLHSFVARAEAEFADVPEAAKLVQEVASCMIVAKGMPIQMTNDECVALLRRDARDRRARWKWTRCRSVFSIDLGSSLSGTWKERWPGMTAFAVIFAQTRGATRWRRK